MSVDREQLAIRRVLRHEWEPIAEVDLSVMCCHCRTPGNCRDTATFWRIVDRQNRMGRESVTQAANRRLAR